MKTYNTSHILVFLMVASLMFMSCNRNNASEEHEHDSQLKYLEQVSYLNVKIDDNFWSPKIQLSRENGLPSVFESAKSSIKNFGIAAGTIEGEHDNRKSDAPIYKIIQGTAYSLHHTPDKELEAFTDDLIDNIVAAQLDDGYLITYFIVNDLDRRWTNIKRDHELFSAGHLFEAAIAYYEVTGKRKFLDAAIKFADHIDNNTLDVTYVPFYSWANRDDGKMTVWAPYK